MITTPKLQFDLRDLPDEGVKKTGSVTFEELGIPDDKRIKCPEPMEYSLHIAPVGNGVLVRGKLWATLDVMCDRCLSFGEVEIETEDVFHHLEELEGTIIDLTEAVREDILLAFPITCLCSDECLGLCPSCGSNLNLETCSCLSSMEEENPWSALDGIELPDHQ